MRGTIGGKCEIVGAVVFVGQALNVLCETKRCKPLL
jgi:hypothetical protein